jgi:hypothetical protein
MSAINRATKGARRSRPSPRRQRLGTVTVAWAVSRDAASRVWTIQGGDGEVELRWLLSLDTGLARCVVVDGDRELPLGDGVVSATADDGLLHIQAAAGADEFAATLRTEQVLYARTTAFTRAGVPGGRYEVVR